MKIEFFLHTRNRVRAKMKEFEKDFPTTKDIEKLKEDDITFVANIQYGLLESPKNIVRAIIQYGGDKSFFVLLEGMCVEMIHIAFYLIYEKDENFLSSDLFFYKNRKTSEEHRN